MTITLYNVSKYVPGVLDDFSIDQQPTTNSFRCFNVKVYDALYAEYDGRSLTLRTRDKRTGELRAVSIDTRLFTYFDVV